MNGMLTYNLKINKKIFSFMIMYWQTIEKSTSEQLKSTCNHTAQLKKKIQTCFTLDIANYIPISAQGNEGRHLVHYHCTYVWHPRS